MEAYIVKDNDFKTIGFQVEANGKTLYNFGISHSSPFYFVKQIMPQDWMTEIFELIRISEQMKAEQTFCQHFFEAVHDSEFVHITEGCGVNMSKSKERLQRLEEKQMNIINNII